MEMKIINLQKAEFKNTPKIKVTKMMQHASPFCWNFIAATQNDTQYFVWPPFACMHAWQRRGMLLETTDGVLGYFLPDLDQGITELLESLRCNLTVSDGPKHNVPVVFYWI